MAKVYVSSTIADLQVERNAVLEWLRKARHQAVDSYVPDSDTVRDSCLEDIDGCDLYVLILGHRYGFQPDGRPDGLSITHLEFRRAAPIPRVALLRTSIPDVRLSDLEDPQRAKLVTAFRAEVQSTVRAAEFGDLHGLIQGLSAGVQHELEKRRDSQRRRGQEWIDAHLRDVARQFATHTAASALRSGGSSDSLYLDLLVRQRHFGQDARAEATASGNRSLEEVIAGSSSPLLLIGEGGAGKTTSLLHTAARMADRARTDPAAPVPIYVNLAKLTVLEDVADLNQLIVDSVPLVHEWDELAALIAAERRRIVFLLDSFNEIPEQLQRTAAVVLSRFVDKQQKNHCCLVGSRLVPHIEQLARPPSDFQTFEILRLTHDQIQAFLQTLGLGTLYDRLPSELRELAGNPFMLSAIAGTLAGKPDTALPRNRGKLYQSFVHEWMLREGKKQRGLAYSYERVKQPMLAYLAKRMTAAGETMLARSDDLDAELEAQLNAIYERIKRRGGMPDDWTVDAWLDETLGDGLLKRVSERLHFMHQSVQEYFTAVHFRESGADALVEFTPKLVWEAVSTYTLAEPPNHRLVTPLLMVSGLLEDSTAIVDALAPRNPVLAAAAISSANRVDPTLLARLEQEWLDLLDHHDEAHRIVGCSCLVLASMRSPRAVRRLVSFATSENFSDSYLGVPALSRLGAADAIGSALIERTGELSEGDFDLVKRRIAEAAAKIQSPQLVASLFDAWRASPEGAELRKRFSGLLASIDQSMVSEELERTRAAASDPVAVAGADRALAERPGWHRLTGIISALELRSIRERAKAKYEADSNAARASLGNAREEQLIGALHSPEVGVRSAAAVLAAERRAPLGNAILDSILRFDPDWGWNDRVHALVSLWGESITVARLVEASGQACRLLGSLNPELARDLADRQLSGALKAELKRLGVDERLGIEGEETRGDMTIWTLRPSGWSGFRPRYELRSAPHHLEIYDCNLAARAFTAIAEISGDDALDALRGAIHDERPEIACLALEALGSRGDPVVASQLLTELQVGRSQEFTSAALRAIAAMRAREALVLIDELPRISRAEWSDAHPVWGPCPHSPGWADAVHQILASIDATSEIQQWLDAALASEDAARKEAALKEVARLVKDREAGAAWRDTWASEPRLRRILELTLSDSGESVRSAAADALSEIGAEGAERVLAERLTDNPTIRVAAGEALVRLNASSGGTRLAEAMRAVVDAPHAQELRRRAAKVLAAVSGGLEPFHQPIQAALLREDVEGALRLIDAAVELFPSDADLYWWRGHALRAKGALAEAAASFHEAAELMKDAAVIPQALAETFLELGDYSRAMEASRRGTEIAVHDADAQSILAWSCYKAGAPDDAVAAAMRAVALNPVHPNAIWVAVIARLRQGDLQGARSAFEHARRVSQALSPGFDSSFEREFREELAVLAAEEGEIGRVAAEIAQAAGSNGSRPVNLPSGAS